MARRAFAVAVAAYMAVGAWRAATATATATVCGFGFTNAFHHFLAGGAGGSSHHFATGRMAQTTPQSLTAHGNRFGFFARFRAEAFHQNDRHLLFGEVLNFFHKAFFIERHQTHRFTT